MGREAYFVVGVNGRGKPVEVFQPNLRAAQVTRDRLVEEGLTEVQIEFWDYKNERSVVG